MIKYIFQESQRHSIEQGIVIINIDVDVTFKS